MKLTTKYHKFEVNSDGALICNDHSFGRSSRFTPDQIPELGAQLLKLSHDIQVYADLCREYGDSTVELALRQLKRKVVLVRDLTAMLKGAKLSLDQALEAPEKSFVGTKVRDYHNRLADIDNSGEDISTLIKTFESINFMNLIEET